MKKVLIKELNSFRIT